jgi:hypothetical protein
MIQYLIEYNKEHFLIFIRYLFILLNHVNYVVKSLSFIILFLIS